MKSCKEPLSIASLQRAFDELQKIQERTGKPVLMTPRYLHLDLRKFEDWLTIKSVSKPVKVSGFVPKTDHQQLTKLAEENKTTIGVLVATGVRILLKTPARHLRGLPMDGRRA